MKKILKFNLYFILAICICSFSIINTKAIITDTFRVGSVESDKFSTTIRKVSEYNYVVSNANGGSITVTTSSGNLRCAFQNVTTNVSSMGNKCTIYGSIPSKKYEVKIFSENDNFSNPQYFKVLTIDVKNSDSSLSNVNLKSVTDNNGKKLETYINDYYHYTYTNDTSSINIVASSSSAKCEVTSTGITSGLVSNKNTCTIKKEGFKKGTYKIKITNGNSVKYYLIALTPTSGYSTSVSSVTAYGLGNIVRKIDDGEYNVLFYTGEIRVKTGDLGAYCNFTSSSSSLSKFSGNSECGLYAGIKTGSYPFTVTNGKESRDYKLNVVSSDSSMKDVSIKSLDVNSDETSTKDTDGHYTVKHNGKLYFKVTPNSSNATCRITDYYKTTKGIYQSGNTCYVNLEDAQSGSYYLEVMNGDTTKFFVISYELKSGSTGRSTPRKIVLNQTNNIYLNKGRSFEITAIVLPGNATNREVSWTTSDSTIATVTDNGMIYGEKPGIATITATSKLDSSIKKSVNVIINETTSNVVKTTNGNSDNNDTNKLPGSSNSSSSVPSSSDPSSSTPGSNNSGTGSDNKSYLKEIFDINNDKVVNQTDYSIISYYYLKSPKILNSKSFSIWKAHFDVINPNGIDLVNVKDVGYFILGTYSKVSNYNSSNLSSSSSNGIGS